MAQEQHAKLSLRQLVATLPSGARFPPPFQSMSDCATPCASAAHGHLAATSALGGTDLLRVVDKWRPMLPGGSAAIILHPSGSRAARANLTSLREVMPLHWRLLLWSGMEAPPCIGPQFPRSVCASLDGTVSMHPDAYAHISAAPLGVSPELIAARRRHNDTLPRVAVFTSYPCPDQANSHPLAGARTRGYWIYELARRFPVDVYSSRCHNQTYVTVVEPRANGWPLRQVTAMPPVHPVVLTAMPS